MGVTTAVLGTAANAAGAAAPLLATIPGKTERTEKKALNADQASLAGSAGGLSRGEYQQRLGSAIGTSQAAQRGAMETLAGSNSAALGTGLADQRALSVLNAGQQGAQAALAATNEADQQAAAQRRAENQARVQAQIDRETARRQQLAQAIPQTAQGVQSALTGGNAKAFGAGQNSLLQANAAALAGGY